MNLNNIPQLLSLHCNNAEIIAQEETGAYNVTLKEMPVAPSFQGDFVVNKQVQNEVNSVQGGGIGFNINEI